MGLALAPMIEDFVEQRDSSGTRRVPMGKCWEAFEDLCFELERAAISSLNDAPQSGWLARMLSKLTGEPIGHQPLAASDYARIDGQREALRAVRVAVATYCELARKPQAKEAQQPRAAGAYSLPFGRGRL